MRIKIVSDGTPSNTSVVNPDTGERIDGLVGATWSCSVDNLAEAVLTFELVECDVIGEGVVATVGFIEPA